MSKCQSSLVNTEDYTEATLSYMMPWHFETSFFFILLLPLIFLWRMYCTSICYVIVLEAQSVCFKRSHLKRQLHVAAERYRWVEKWSAAYKDFQVAGVWICLQKTAPTVLAVTWMNGNQLLGQCAKSCRGNWYPNHAHHFWVIVQFSLVISIWSSGFKTFYRLLANHREILWWKYPLAKQ